MRGVHRRRWREIEACSRAEAVRLEVQARHVPRRRAVVSGRGSRRGCKRRRAWCGGARQGSGIGGGSSGNALPWHGRAVLAKGASVRLLKPKAGGTADGVRLAMGLVAGGGRRAAAWRGSPLRGNGGLRCLSLADDRATEKPGGLSPLRGKHRPLLGACAGGICVRSPWSSWRSVHPRAGFRRRRRCWRCCRRRCQRWCRCRSRLQARFVVHAADTCRQACRCSAPRSSPCRTDLRGRSKKRGWRGSKCRCSRPNLRLFSDGVQRCRFFRTRQRGGRWPGHRLALGRRAASLACCLLLIDVVLPELRLAQHHLGGAGPPPEDLLSLVLIHRPQQTIGHGKLPAAPSWSN